MKQLIVCLVLCMAGVSAAAAAVIQVPGEQADLQLALDLCSRGDTVLVAAGTYTVNLIWPATDGIKLLSVAGAEATTLDGNRRDQVLGIYSGVDSTTVIRGFTITRGVAGGM